MSHGQNACSRLVVVLRVASSVLVDFWIHYSKDWSVVLIEKMIGYFVRSIAFFEYCRRRDACVLSPVSLCLMNHGRDS
jgi:hypothetical protein